MCLRVVAVRVDAELSLSSLPAALRRRAFLVHRRRINKLRKHGVIVKHRLSEVGVSKGKKDEGVEEEDKKQLEAVLGANVEALGRCDRWTCRAKRRSDCACCLGSPRSTTRCAGCSTNSIMWSAAS